MDAIHRFGLLSPVGFQAVKPAGLSMRTVQPQFGGDYFELQNPLNEKRATQLRFLQFQANMGGEDEDLLLVLKAEQERLDEAIAKLGKESRTLLQYSDLASVELLTSRDFPGSPTLVYWSLLQRVLRGDPDAFEALQRRKMPKYLPWTISQYARDFPSQMEFMTLLLGTHYAVSTNEQVPEAVAERSQAIVDLLLPACREVFQTWSETLAKRGYSLDWIGERVLSWSAVLSIEELDAIMGDKDLYAQTRLLAGGMLLQRIFLDDEKKEYVSNLLKSHQRQFKQDIKTCLNAHGRIPTLHELQTMAQIVGVIPDPIRQAFTEQRGEQLSPTLVIPVDDSSIWN